MKAVTLVCTAMVFCAGVIVLAGWSLGNEALKTVVPGMVAMKANTAVALVLSSMGLALPCIIQPGKWLRALLILAGAPAQRRTHPRSRSHGARLTRRDIGPEGQRESSPGRQPGVCVLMRLTPWRGG